ncbi:hypothetical protein TRFO_22292 [Tritrichomonas foetus]|uniref:Uncharacterized protein n=1 Tax=Tritrichomonas foetus TaxID=1144522 RepID=A0A1J4KC13_9EUKA|nr:hypothetical protein TRFO_22292 [Tritrichomonas foetus]|eukprot:OHT08959.1 hypothetical protein TRFO_22292 [Tritrichomonas foetus]
MSIIIPAQTTCTNYANNVQQVTFGCCSTYVAFGYPNFIILYKIINNRYEYDFYLKITDTNAPYLVFNDNCQSENLILAAFSQKCITFIDVNQKVIISTISTGCEYFLWDLLIPYSFYQFTLNGILQHCILKPSSNYQKYDVNWSYEFAEPPIRIIIPQNSPNSFFVLTYDGIFYHFTRSNPSKLPRLVRAVNIDSSNQKITDIYTTYLDFILIITPNEIAFYHYLKFKLVWMLRKAKHSPNFFRAYSHPTYPDYLFILLENRDFCLYKFSHEKKAFTVSGISLSFQRFEKKFIRSIYVHDDGFLFFTNDLKVSFVKLTPKLFIIQNTFSAPLQSSKSSAFSLYKGKLAYYHHSNHIHIVNSQTLELKNRIAVSKPVIDIIWYNEDILIYATSIAVTAVYLSPFFKEKVLLSSHLLSSSTDSLSLSCMKYCNGNLLIKLGTNCIVSFSLTSPKKDLYTLKNCINFEAIEYKNSFSLAIQIEDDIVTIYTDKGKMIQTISASLGDIAGFFVVNDSISTYFKNGNLLINKEIKRLYPASSIKFVNNILFVASSQNIYCYRYDDTFQLQSDIKEKNACIHMIDENIILYQTQEKAIKTIIFELNDQMVLINQNCKKFSTTNCDKFVKWPGYERLQNQYIEKVLYMTLDILSYTIPILDDITEIGFLLGEKLPPLQLMDGESPSNFYRNIFLSFADIELSETQKVDFLYCAKAWETCQRFMNAAVMYHFLKEHKKAAKCLIGIRMYDLCIYYSRKYNLPKLEKNAILKSSIYIGRKGDYITAAFLANHLGEIHLALHFLYLGSLFYYIIDIIDKNIDGIRETTFHEDFLGFQIVPLDEIICVALNKTS